MINKDVLEIIFSHDYLLQRTKLIHGLPAINVDNFWIIYSPYSQKITRISDGFIVKDEMLDFLKKSQLLGKPKSKYCAKTGEKNLSLIVTSDCNLRCKYCFTKGGDYDDRMNKKMAKGVIESIINKDTKIIRLTFFGGEPTLNYNVIKAATEYANQKVPIVKCHISTNGVVSKNVLNYLIKNKFTINVSVDGSPDDQDLLRRFPNGEGSSKNVERTLRYLVQKNAKFKVRSTITDRTVKNMPKSVKYFSKLGIRYIHLEPVNISGRAFETEVLQPNPEVFVTYFIKAMNIASKKKVRIINSAYMNILEPAIHYCGAAAGDKMILSPSGDVTLCFEVQNTCHPQSSKFIVGKVNADGKIKNKEKISSKHLEYSVEKIEECKQCFAKYICSGGCPVRNIDFNNHLTKINEYYCKIKRGLLYHVILRLGRKAGFC